MQIFLRPTVLAESIFCVTMIVSLHLVFSYTGEAFSSNTLFHCEQASIMNLQQQRLTLLLNTSSGWFNIMYAHRKTLVGYRLRQAFGVFGYRRFSKEVQFCTRAPDFTISLFLSRWRRFWNEPQNAQLQHTAWTIIAH